MVSWLTDEEMQILRSVKDVFPKLREILEEVRLIRKEDGDYYTQLSKQNAKILDAIQTLSNSFTPQPAGFKAVITINQTEGEKTMALPKKAARLAAAITENDDGTSSLNVGFTDTEGLPITSLTVWPTAVALPTAAFSDATPGPSALIYTPAATPTVSTAVAGAFVVGSIVPVQPAPNPLPAGWGQNVDVQVSIASGLTNQTAPITDDAGTITVVADPNNPASFTVSVTEP